MYDTICPVDILLMYAYGTFMTKYDEKLHQSLLTLLLWNLCFWRAQQDLSNLMHYCKNNCSFAFESEEVINDSCFPEMWIWISSICPPSIAITVSSAPHKNIGTFRVYINMRNPGFQFSLYFSTFTIFIFYPVVSNLQNTSIFPCKSVSLPSIYNCQLASSKPVPITERRLLAEG